MGKWKVGDVNIVATEWVGLVVLNHMKHTSEKGKQVSMLVRISHYLIIEPLTDNKAPFGIPVVPEVNEMVAIVSVAILT